MQAVWNENMLDTTASLICQAADVRNMHHTDQSYGGSRLTLSKTKQTKRRANGPVDVMYIQVKHFFFNCTKMDEESFEM